MNLFSSLIGELSNGGKSSNNESKTGGYQTVNTGADTKKVGLYQGAVKAIQSNAVCPNNTTKDAIVAADKEWRQLAARNFKLGELAKRKLKGLAEVSRGVQIQQNYQNGVMSLVENFELQAGSYGIRMEQHDISVSANREGYTAYVAEIQGGSDETAANLSKW